MVGEIYKSFIFITYVPTVPARMCLFLPASSHMLQLSWPAFHTHAPFNCPSIEEGESDILKRSSMKTEVLGLLQIASGTCWWMRCSKDAILCNILPSLQLDLGLTEEIPRKDGLHQGGIKPLPSAKLAGPSAFREWNTWLQFFGRSRGLEARFRKGQVDNLPARIVFWFKNNKREMCTF